MTHSSRWHLVRSRSRLGAAVRRGIYGKNNFRSATSRGRRCLVWFVLGAFLLQTSACTRKLQVPTDDPLALASVAHSRGGWRIAGYTTADGVEHAYRGSVRVGEDGQFHFKPEAMGFSATSSFEPFVLPRDQVRQFLVVESSELGSVGGVIVIAAAVSLVVLMIVAATSEPEPYQGGSCPLLYAWDGEHFVLDGEPYGGAIARGLERTDWCELSSLRAEESQYRILLRNPADETDHTNSMRLLVVDHEPGTRVVRDGRGGMHALRRVVALASAVDRHEVDAARMLRAADHDEMFTDLEAGAALAARDTVEIEFARPVAVSEAWLVARLRSSAWSGRVLRDFVELHGTAAAFAAAVDGDARHRQELLAWSEREELFACRVELLEGNRWVAQGRLVGGSPWVEEDQALRLDLRRVEGDRVRVRLCPPATFWTLDCFELGWDEAVARVDTLRPRTATDAHDIDVRTALMADDARTLDFPAKGDHAWVSFDAPLERPGRARTVFAEVRGWYELHVDGTRPADLATLGTLREPGAIVRRSLALYEAARKSTALTSPTAPSRR